MSRLYLAATALLASLAIGSAPPDGTPPIGASAPDGTPHPAPSAEPATTRSPASLASAFPITFDSEWIRLYIVGDSLEVRGTYWLCCHRQTEGEIPLIYPFPEDSLLGRARMISVTARVDAAAATTVRFDGTRGYSGVRWRVPPCTGDTIAVEAVYRQKILGNYARYIVTTTRAWDRPLRRARFEIHLPPGTEPTEFSFPFVRRELDGEIFYAYEAESFLPDHDISVRWRR